LKERGGGRLFILSAPSGAGKSTLIRRVMENLGGLAFSVSFTTRLPRANEEEGRDYCFVSLAAFKEMIERGAFLEWAEVLGNYYGTLRPDLEKLASEGKDLLLDIDIQGAKKVLQQVPRAVSVFILPPSPKVLEERLVKRGLDASEIIRRRLAHAAEEIAEVHRYQYVLINDNLDTSVRCLEAIILAERCRNEKKSYFHEIMEEWEVENGKDHSGRLSEERGKPF
jgi:guanylate kinase